jgi:RNA polymerase sigma-54 factor
MALGQALQQKQLLKLLPQQIQLMKLLQVPTANLEERIKEELEENPALEMTEDEGRDDTDLEGQEALSDYELAGDSDDDDGDSMDDSYDIIDLSDYDTDDEIAD